MSALIGWHSGNWHWNLTALVNVPIGPYDESSSSNISFNHWGVDTSAAVTWLDAPKGHEVSVAAGFTFNWENPATDYRTGTEFHVEWALIQHLSKTASIDRDKPSPALGHLSGVRHKAVHGLIPPAPLFAAIHSHHPAAISRLAARHPKTKVLIDVSEAPR